MPITDYPDDIDAAQLAALGNRTTLPVIEMPPSIGRIIAHPWIPVGVRLPEVKGQAVKTSRMVLIVQSGAVGVGHLVVTTERGHYWFDDILRRDVDVTHWQPLPLLPSEGE